MRRSRALPRFLSAVLQLGNYMNAGGEPARAVNLSSLRKLRETRAFDKKTTALEFLVQVESHIVSDTFVTRGSLMPKCPCSPLYRC